jgi:hypothetical protein
MESFPKHHLAHSQHHRARLQSQHIHTGGQRAGVQGMMVAITIQELTTDFPARHIIQDRLVYRSDWGTHTIRIETQFK